MTQYQYTTRQHPTSGETYAVRLDDGQIAAVAGPLHHTDRRDDAALAMWIANAAPGDAEDDAAWLRAELGQEARS